MKDYQFIWYSVAAEFSCMIKFTTHLWKKSLSQSPWLHVTLLFQRAQLWSHRFLIL